MALKEGTQITDKSKSDQIKEVLPLIADQAQFMETKEYINEIATKLKPEEWIWVSNDELETDNLSSVKQRDGPWIKPRGLFLSKGEWLFSEAATIFDRWITKVTVNYDNILVVTNKEQSKQLVDKYGVQSGFMSIDWSKVAADYQGFAVVPNLYDPEEAGPDYEYEWNAGWDVSTLVLWDKAPIIKIETVLNTKDFLTPETFTDETKFDTQMKEIIKFL